MENLVFLKIEIFIFFTSFLYIIYYFLEKIYGTYFRTKNISKISKKWNDKLTLNKVNINKNEVKTTKSSSKQSSKAKLSDNDKQKLVDIIKRVKINSSKWYFDSAKNLIVEWLSIDKYNRELNVELASIYEREKNYLNAEYIYKDLLEVLKVDFEVMKKLGYVYALQWKFKESLKIYEQIHNKKMSDDEVIDILAELTFDMKNYKKAMKYINLFLTWKPRDVNKLFMRAKCLKVIWKSDDAINCYKRILELQPYNTKAKEKREKLIEKRDKIAAEEKKSVDEKN